MTRLEFLAVMRALEIILEKEEYQAALDLVQELAEEAKRKNDKD